SKIKELYSNMTPEATTPEVNIITINFSEPSTCFLNLLNNGSKNISSKESIKANKKYNNKPLNKRMIGRTKTPPIYINSRELIFFTY
ncbi:MAG: hypothetical protein LPH19_11695, partial [Shewanella sp.]|nr:hypothetical protein [Shewanella sp.]